MRGFTALRGRSSLLRRGRASSLLPSVRLASSVGKTDTRVCGVGINDARRVLGYSPSSEQLGPNGEIVTSKGTCPYYRRWSDMLKRCYSAAYHAQEPTYIGCSVCEDWLTFSKFRAWMARQDGYWERKDGETRTNLILSHSVLSRDNKLYSPETSFFVPRGMADLFNDSAAARGDSPLGVSLDKRKEKYEAKLTFEGTNKFIGYYDTAAEAHRAWLPRKRAYALLVIDKLLPANVPYYAPVRKSTIARAHEEYADVEPSTAV